MVKPRLERSGTRVYCWCAHASLKEANSSCFTEQSNQTGTTGRSRSRVLMCWSVGPKAVLTAGHSFKPLEKILWVQTRFERRGLRAAISEPRDSCAVGRDRIAGHVIKLNLQHGPFRRSRWLARGCFINERCEGGKNLAGPQARAGDHQPLGRAAEDRLVSVGLEQAINMISGASSRRNEWPFMPIIVEVVIGAVKLHHGRHTPT